MSQKNKDRPFFNYELLEEINSFDNRQMQNFYTQNKQHFINGNFLQSEIQNLQILDYILQNNINNFFQNLDQQDLNLEQLFQEATGSKDISKKTNLWIFMNNLLFFSMVNRNRPVSYYFELVQKQLSLNKANFQQPSIYAKIKILFAGFNYAMNYQDVNYFFANYYALKQLRMQANNFFLQKQVCQENLFYTPLITSSKYQYNSCVLQNNFNVQEFKLATKIIDLMKDLIINNQESFSTNFQKLKNKITEFQKLAKTTLKKGQFHPSIFLDKLTAPQIPIVPKNYEEKDYKSLIIHLQAIQNFFQVQYQIRFEKNYELALKNIFSKNFYSKESSEFKDAYSLASFNLLAYVNVANQNNAIAKEVWSKGVEELKLYASQRNSIDILNLQNSNNQMYQVSIYYNIGLMNLKLENYNQAIQILKQLGAYFNQNYMYWYRLGYAYYKKFEKRLQVLSEKCNKEFDIVMNQNVDENGNKRFFVFNSKNILKLYFREQMKFKKNQNPLRANKLNELESSILCFFNCFYVLKYNETLKNNIQQFSGVKKKLYKQLQIFLAIQQNQRQKIFISCLEFLVFLNIAQYQELQANYYLEILAQQKEITLEQMRKTKIYQQIIKLRIKKKTDKMKSPKLSGNDNFIDYVSQYQKKKVDLQDAWNYNLQVKNFLVKKNKQIQLDSDKSDREKKLDWSYLINKEIDKEKIENFKNKFREFFN